MASLYEIVNIVVKISIMESKIGINTLYFTII